MSDEKIKQILDQHFKPIQTRKVNYHNEDGSKKPVAIIYNSNSGKLTNLVPEIEAKLNGAEIPFTLFPTERAFDTYRFANRVVNLSEYSVLCAVGGDGSYHEVFNGMLNREDGVMIPLCFIPNGSGNNGCNTLGIKSVD